MALGGDGPILESFFTGTAFVATVDGLLLTNRHVVLPWEFDDAARMVMAQGLEPVMRRLQGFLPGVSEAFQVSLVVAWAMCGQRDGRTDQVIRPHSSAAADDPVMSIHF